MVRQKKYITGDYLEIEIFNLPAEKKPFKRQRRIKESSPTQKNLNNKKAQRYFVRLVHKNFNQNDLYVDLTYNQENLPDSKEEILRDIRNYIARLKRYRKKEGLPELKYIYVISNHDQIGNKVRYHVHMIINSMDRDVAEKKWKKGFCNTDRLQFNETGVTGKSIYMTRQAKGERSWSSSINLKKPVAIVSDYKVKRRQLEHMANNPDDRLFIEKLINGKKQEWIFTDCIVERDGRQTALSGIVSEGFGQGVSVMIRARRSEFAKANKKRTKSSLLSQKRNSKPRRNNKRNC